MLDLEFFLFKKLFGPSPNKLEKRVQVLVLHIKTNYLSQRAQSSQSFGLVKIVLLIKNLKLKTHLFQALFKIVFGFWRFICTHITLISLCPLWL